jgi:hypothetical protein
LKAMFSEASYGIIAESFYNVKYGLSVITSKTCQTFSVMKT